MAKTDIPALEHYWEALRIHLRPFPPDEQRAAVALYRELAKGRAVDAAQLAQALGVSPAEARTLLERDSIKAFVYPDDQGRVLGFGGLAAAPMHHRSFCRMRRSSARPPPMSWRSSVTSSSFSRRACPVSVGRRSIPGHSSIR
jgi:hypothetical protein